MNKDKKDPDYPVELESQFIMRFPEEPAKSLKELIKSGENFKNRLSISLENDMRHGEVRFDHWLLHAKVVDLPTITESLKTIDRKSVYKTADICQMMICKEEIDHTSEEELPSKNKKKDPLKVDKKFLCPHGITPPTKNIRRRRFRKTLKKKCAEAPEIEKEVKRLLRADNEAVSVTWEVIKEENDNAKNESVLPTKPKTKKNLIVKAEQSSNNQSKVEDIFGGAVSDSDAEDDNIDIEDSRMSACEDQMSDSNSVQGSEYKGRQVVTQFKSEMFSPPSRASNIVTPSMNKKSATVVSGSSSYKDQYKHDFNDSSTQNVKVQQLTAELEELKLRKHRTQLEISGLQNMTLKQRFQDILHTLNNEIQLKEIEINNCEK
ncbi:Transcription initiation factor TFIID subunit 7 [Papilio xuthus]|uniref:Transcription initiation factor TFIID subunit 7 n=1 Tax=Papilio xuthus TaxID=66420 RepID=A0A194PGX2_PAPXU|nr:Transcription initiation factor TFIID subunit 7 [Papilio xuthus]